MLTCATCSEPLAEGDTFCGECGGKVDAAPTSTVGRTATIPPATPDVPAFWTPKQEASVPVRHTPDAPGSFGSNSSAGRPAASDSVIRVPAIVIDILLAIPMILLSIFLVSLVTGVFAFGYWPLSLLYLVAWLVVGPLLLIPAVEQNLAWTFFRLRPPTAQEWESLGSSWQEVCETANVDPDRYFVRVQDVQQINAYAAGGTLVGVTRFALTLPSDQLAAVLAHELGHHVHGHARLGIVLWWYTMPARFVLAIFQAVIRIFVRYPSLIAVVGVVLGFVLLAIALAGTVVASVLSLGRGGVQQEDVAVALAAASLLFLLPVVVIVAFVYLEPWLSRRRELQADRYALSLNYGIPLLDLFRRWQAEGHDDAQTTTALRLLALASHPPVWKRIIQAETYLGH